MVFGLIGIAIILAIKKRKSYENVFVLGWTIAILIMSLKPQWLFLDLPSTRIANYISFPLAISGAFALAWILEKMQSSEGKCYLNQKISFILCSILFAFMLASGFYDNSQSINTESNYQKAMQTKNASEYAAKYSTESELTVKDHNYLTADSWIKISFMGDYNYPFSRGYFKRYEDTTKPREMCTLWMISEPNTSNGQKCSNDLGVNFVMVNPAFDSAQFQKSEEFWQVYSGKEINIYYKNK
jgi:asparagine N-glycosylation enzyme membrane subunit Stt3